MSIDAKINKASWAHRNMNTRVQMPIRIRQPRELWRNAPPNFEFLLASILMPLEQEIYEAVALESIVGRVRDRVKEILERFWCGWRVEGVGVSNSTT